MKVLVIPTWYPSGKDKLMGIYHKEFTEALNDLNIKADMLFIDRQRLNNPIKYLFMKKKEIEIEKNYKIYKYRMLNLGKLSFNLQLKNYIKKMEYAYLDYIKHNSPPDVIHAHVTIPAGYAASIIGKKYNIPVIVTEHLSTFKRFYKKPLSKYSDFVFKNSTYSTVSNYMKKIVLNYTDECHVIPNLIDTKPFENNIKRKLDDTFRLVSVCALREGKKLDIIFKSIKLINDKEKIKIHLDIIGDGFFENYFKQACDELELNEYVTFLGRKSKQEIADIFKKEHALIISSELETFAIPGIEAMASGLPVISTKCQGPEEYIDDLSGVLCEVNDPEDMAKAILELYNNYDKYDSNYIKSIANNFSKEVVINRCKKIYEKIKCR